MDRQERNYESGDLWARKCGRFAFKTSIFGDFSVGNFNRNNGGFK